MNFVAFREKLFTLEKSIAITEPVALQVKRAYWGAPGEAISDLPAVINTLVINNRVLGFGSRRQSVRINIQLLATKARAEDTRSYDIATRFWFAALDAFDGDHTIGGSVPLATLQGADPTVPVLLTHADIAYIGFSGYIELNDIEAFTF